MRVHVDGGGVLCRAAAAGRSPRCSVRAGRPAAARHCRGRRRPGARVPARRRCLGRDVLSRTLHGARASLGLALVATLGDAGARRAARRRGRVWPAGASSAVVDKGRRRAARAADAVRDRGPAGGAAARAATRASSWRLAAASSCCSAGRAWPRGRPGDRARRGEPGTRAGRRGRSGPRGGGSSRVTCCRPARASSRCRRRCWSRRSCSTESTLSYVGLGFPDGVPSWGTRAARCRQRRGAHPGALDAGRRRAPSSWSCWSPTWCSIRQRGDDAAGPPRPASAGVALSVARMPAPAAPGLLHSTNAVAARPLHAHRHAVPQRHGRRRRHPPQRRALHADPPDRSGRARLERRGGAARRRGSRPRHRRGPLGDAGRRGRSSPAPAPSPPRRRLPRASGRATSASTPCWCARRRSSRT